MKPFRTFDGCVANAEKRLDLNLGDFATDALSADHASVPMSIPFSRLFDIVQEAEAMGPTEDGNAAENGIKSRRITRKRRISSSSAEQIRSEDEAIYVDRERTTMERAERADKDFEDNEEPAAKRRG